MGSARAGAGPQWLVGRVGGSAIWAKLGCGLRAVADWRQRRRGVGGLEDLGRNRPWAEKGKEKEIPFYFQKTFS
jgi:hypothetical protein